MQKKYFQIATLLLGFSVGLAPQAGYTNPTSTTYAIPDANAVTVSYIKNDRDWTVNFNATTDGLDWSAIGHSSHDPKKHPIKVQSKKKAWVSVSEAYKESTLISSYETNDQQPCILQVLLKGKNCRMSQDSSAFVCVDQFPKQG